MKNCNEKGVVASINKIDSATEILLQSSIKYWKLGVFIDVRCYNASKISTVILQVRYFLEHSIKVRFEQSKILYMKYIFHKLNEFFFTSVIKKYRSVFPSKA